MDNSFLTQLKQIRDESTSYSFAKKLKQNDELLAWVHVQTKHKLPPSATVSERGYYLLYGKPECSHGNDRKYLTFSRGYGYCARAEKCQCQKDDNSIASQRHWAQKTKEHKDEINQKRNKTNLEKYGVENIGQSQRAIDSRKKTYSDPEKVKLIGERIKKTKLEKYGDENWVNSERRKKTCLEKYGVEEHLSRPDVWDNIRNTNMKKYGVPYVSMDDTIRDKQKATLLKNYNVEHPNQNISIFKKAQSTSFKKKIYEFPSGRVEYVQGFEPQALNILMNKEKIKEHDIYVGEEVPIIRWSDQNGKPRVHYPDIYIKSQNRIVEVKSTYTIRSKKELLIRKEFAEKEGYIYNIYVLDVKGNIIELIDK